MVFDTVMFPNARARKTKALCQGSGLASPSAEYACNNLMIHVAKVGCITYTRTTQEHQRIISPLVRSCKEDIREKLAR